jgi:hypothetical protein
MARSDVLDPADYELLAQIMTGPHGRMLTSQSPADLLIVFSCADPDVGRTAALLYRQGLVNRVIFSGGAGKDSGELPALGITEAVFLASIAIAEGLPTGVILLEQDARNGKENAAFSLQRAAALGVLQTGARIAGLAPAVRSRRLYEELRYQADCRPFSVEVVAGLSSGAADSNQPSVREELARELAALRTMHEGAEPSIHPQPDFQPGGRYWELTVRASRDSQSPTGSRCLGSAEELSPSGGSDRSAFRVFN